VAATFANFIPSCQRQSELSRSVLLAKVHNLFTASFEAVGFELEILLSERTLEPAEEEGDGTGENECHGCAGAVREWFDRVDSSHACAGASGYPGEAAVLFEFGYAPSSRGKFWLADTGAKANYQGTGREFFNFGDTGSPFGPAFDITPDGPDGFGWGVDVDAVRECHVRECTIALNT